MVTIGSGSIRYRPVKIVGHLGNFPGSAACDPRIRRLSYLFVKSAAKKGDFEGVKIVAQNRAASYNYELLDKLEAGLVLVGTEVKTLREGKGTLRDVVLQRAVDLITTIGVYESKPPADK